MMTAEPVSDTPLAVDLVTRARNGDKQAWDALVERYAPLIWSICRRHRLRQAPTPTTSARASGCSLVDQLDRIRDPAALPGWLATTTRRECLPGPARGTGTAAAGHVPDAEIIPDEQAGTAEQELLAAERHAALREAFTQLPPDWPAADRPARSRTRRCPTPRSAPGWASRSAASGPIAAAAWTSYAATRPSPR